MMELFQGLQLWENVDLYDCILKGVNAENNGCSESSDQ